MRSRSGKYNIKILFAEDVISDAELALMELENASIHCQSLRVETEPDFIDALHGFNPDLVISDYLMPSFNGMRALVLTRQFAPAMPFIIMTGSMNEATAVACMKAGATDYVIKEHRSRLPFAVIEAISQLREQEDKKNTERMLKASEKRYTSLFHDNSAVMLLIDSESLEIVDANPAACSYYGLPFSDLVGQVFSELAIRPETGMVSTPDPVGPKDSSHFETRHRLHDGTIRDVEVFMGTLNSTDRSLCYAIIHDITDRRRAESELERRSHELSLNQEATISSMALLSEYRDKGTGEHIQRTKEYVRILLENSEARSLYPPEHMDLICQSAAIHDIGKVGIPDTILLKPGTLTPEEFELMKTHTVIGRTVLARTQSILGENSFLRYALEITEFHHERWDGTGYPRGLAGTDIPFLARIMAIADVYDALVTSRPYKEAMDHSVAVSVIRRGSGKGFDPSLVSVFLEHEADFASILAAHLD